VIRDFKKSHPDFNGKPVKSEKGIVKQALGRNLKPRYNYRKAQKLTTTSEKMFDSWFNDVKEVNKRVEINFKSCE
jgi:hypothetical protein